MSATDLFGSEIQAPRPKVKRPLPKVLPTQPLDAVVTPFRPYVAIKPSPNTCLLINADCVSLFR